MQDILTQRDLDRLPQPRLIFTAKLWVRHLATGFLAFAALCSFGLAWSVTGPGALLYASAARIAAVVCLLVLVLARPYDWRSWVNVAATLNGLYVTAGRARLVFVPWRDVMEIGTARVFTAKGGPRIVPRLKLRLSEADWSLFGNLSGVTGTGPIRSYIFSPAGCSAEATVARLKAFRGKNG